MNFCFAVCEYDPLHNGHVYHISQMKNTKADAVGIIMSGNFTQRGEIAVLNKYTRATHAILAGADIVFELPTVFAVSPAEIFAGGAIKVLSTLGKGNLLCFGSEKGTREQFIGLARATLTETKEFKEILKRELEGGVPFASARANAVKQTISGVNLELFDNPNSILGVEYTRAILAQNSDIDILPIERLGNGFKDRHFGGEFCSASAIREAMSALKLKKAKKFMPDFVCNDLPDTLPDISQAAIYSINEKKGSQIKEVVDCTEGLENRIKVIARSVHSFNELIDRLETKRYTRARLSRIVTSSMLGITKSLVEKSMKGNLYVKVLAVEKSKVDLLAELSRRLENSKTQLITRKSDADSLSGIAEDCFEADIFANDLFNLSAKVKSNEFDMKIVDRKQGK